jgi:hypothetical protein
MERGELMKDLNCSVLTHKMGMAIKEPDNVEREELMKEPGPLSMCIVHV